MGTVINGFFEKTKTPEEILGAVDDKMERYTTDGRFDTISGIKLFCPKNQRKKIAKLFKDTFDPRWIKAREYVEKRYGNCPQEEYDYWPYHVSADEDYGIFISISTFILQYLYGDYYEPDGLGDDAFYAAMDEIKKQYPNIKYYGYIGEFCSDVRCGFCSERFLDYQMPQEERTYDFVGKFLDTALADGSFCAELDYRLECPYEDGDYEKINSIIDYLYGFKEYIAEETFRDVIKMLTETAEKYAGSSSTFADYKKMAEEIQKHIAELEQNSTIPELSSEHHPKKQRETVVYFNDFEAAVDMMKLAESLGELDLSAENGVVSLEKPFDRVIYAAEQGNVEAKFVGGRHLIADKVRGEHERAVRWIREAAEAGYEEAQKCIAKHPEVFI